MELWQKYKRFVESNLSGNLTTAVRGVAYWRDQLFITIVVYILPVSMIAYLPAMFICYRYDELYIAVYDTIAVALVLVLTLHRRMALATRKLFMISTLYLLSITLLYYLGVFGPGLIYMLSTVIFVSLVYSSRLAYLCIILNSLICILFAVGISYGLLGSPTSAIYDSHAWLGVASNHLFLSIVFAVAIHILISGFGETLANEIELKKRLIKETEMSASRVKELKLKNEEMEQFTYIASHDLQEPLNSISGIVEVLKLDGIRQDEKGYSQSLSFIATSVDRLRGLIKGLLDYSKIGRQIKLETIDCQKLIERVLEDLQAALQQAHAKIIIDVSIRQLPPLSVYPLEFNQLFQNLISNAVKFRKRNIDPEVHIKVVGVAGGWQFSIEDNGIGIDNLYLEKIFVIFKRVHGSEAYDGNGIGLAFCKKIVEMHGGRIWVESVQGQGSKFFFTLPHLETLSDIASNERFLLASE